MTNLLVLHVFGAGVVGILILFSVISLIQRKSQQYSAFAKSIAFGGAFQLMTGSLLSLQTEGTITAFCTRIGLYMSVILATEVILYLAMKKFELPYPAFQVATSLSVGMVTVVFTGFKLAL